MKPDESKIDRAKAAAIEVLLHNLEGPFEGLPRTAGWGYPEPYTRDLMISLLGVLVAGDERLLNAWRRVLEVLAGHQTRHGHIPSLVHDPQDRGASDTTPLFLMAVGLFRQATGEAGFLEEATDKALLWMQYQSPADRILVAHLPTSDWRDEQWVVGYGLFVNTVFYTALRLLDQHDRANALRNTMERFTISAQDQHRHVHEGLVLRYKPYYAMWSYKIYCSERFDLLGNSLAILSGIASPVRAGCITRWVEGECEALRRSGDLDVMLPPNFFPYVRPTDPDWYPRYEVYNQPGEYHNGGIWPFICGFYIAALVAVGRYQLARRRLAALTELVRASREAGLEFGFNEWHRAQDGAPRGQNWQTWSAAMYLYAAHCVQTRTTPFFEPMRAARLAGGTNKSLHSSPDLVS
jgi:hypothetical protein